MTQSNTLDCILINRSKISNPMRAIISGRGVMRVGDGSMATS